MLVCNSLCQNVVLLRPFHMRKEMKITGSQVRVDDDGWSNTSHQKCFRSPFVASAVCDQALSWRRTIPEENIPRRLFWIKELNYSTHFTFGRRLYCFRHVHVLTICIQNWQVQCDMIDGYSRDTAQHICAKLHLFFTVVLISRPIGSWKKFLTYNHINKNNTIALIFLAIIEGLRVRLGQMPFLRNEVNEGWSSLNSL